MQRGPLKTGMLEGMTQGKLILLRHGQSQWNESNQFTGWVDVDLTAKGEAEAKRGGELLKEKGLLPEVLYTSLVLSAPQTLRLTRQTATGSRSCAIGVSTSATTALCRA